MGKLGWLAALVLVASAGWADNLRENQRWTESADGAFTFPASTRVAQAFTVGWGGDFSLGYRFDTTFSTALDAGYYQYNLQNPPPLTGETLSYVPLMLVPRINLTDGDVHPYVFCGVGVALNTFSLTVNGVQQVNNKETDFLLAPGLGALYRLDKNLVVFLQGRVDIDFTTTGLAKGIDSPSVFVPIQGGVGFFVL